MAGKKSVDIDINLNKKRAARAIMGNIKNSPSNGGDFLKMSNSEDNISLTSKAMRATKR